MKKILRILFLISPLIILSLAYYEQGRWTPPLDPNNPQPVSIATLLEHPESYQAPILLITHGDVFNKSGDIIYLKGFGDVFLKVNCTDVDIGDVQEGMTLYLRGYSYYHDPSKEYFLAIEIHIHVSYSVYLSIPIAVLVLIILFFGFKFKLKDFSFSRRKEEGSKNSTPNEEGN
ncbi:MAG: hypothetical protein ACTSYB_05005 [Candidatus Helarchaeota archaeon]